MNILRCVKCNSYTLSDKCPKCNARALNPKPPKYSPEDKYGKYRRMAKEQEVKE